MQDLWDSHAAQCPPRPALPGPRAAATGPAATAAVRCVGGEARGCAQGHAVSAFAAPRGGAAVAGVPRAITARVRGCPRRRGSPELSGRARRAADWRRGGRRERDRCSGGLARWRGASARAGHVRGCHARTNEDSPRCQGISSILLSLGNLRGIARLYRLFPFPRPPPPRRRSHHGCAVAAKTALRSAAEEKTCACSPRASLRAGAAAPAGPRAPPLQTPLQWS
jgi:hypothetical protein